MAATAAVLPPDLAAQFSHGEATVNGVRLHYVTGGAAVGTPGAPPVVLLHGWPLTWYSWRKVLPALGAGRAVLAPDFRGLGDSARPGTGYDTPTAAEDVYQLARALGHERVALVAHDLGVAVAYELAATRPAFVERLAVLDVPLVGFGLDEFARAHHLWHFDFFAAPALPEQLLAGREGALIRAFYPSYNPEAMTEEDVAEYARTYTMPGTTDAALAYYRAFPDDARRFGGYSAHKLAMPVLALGGAMSGAGFPFASFAQLATDVRGGIIPNCGHYLAEEQPGALLAALAPFLAEGAGAEGAGAGSAAPGGPHA